MNNQCSIVKDLISLYAEDLVSGDTKAFIEEHLEHCAECRSELKQIRRPVEFLTDTDVTPLKNLKKKLLVKRVQAVLCTAAFVFAVAASVFAILTAPQYYPYADDLVQAAENEKGEIVVTFDDQITGYSYNAGYDEKAGVSVYHISAWNTLWDRSFADRGEQNMIIIPPASQADLRIYYVQNNGEEDALIYGGHPDENAGVVTLPRLILMQYFLLAVFALIVLAAVRFFTRRREGLKVWLDRILLFPISYMAAHLCTKGISFQSCSGQRDFGVIILITVLLYCTALCGISMYKAKKGGGAPAAGL